MKRNGQFYIIASVFVLISLSMLFLFTTFVDFGSLTLPTQSTDFDNLQNSIQQRNDWLQMNWFNLNWKSKVIVNITGGTLTPAEIVGVAGSSINCTKEIKVFSKSGGTFTPVAVDITNATGPCNVIFNAVVGIYEIYYNNSAANENNNVIADPGSITNYDESMEQVPPEGICNQFSNLLPKKNIAFSCSATASTNTYNYSVSFRATDFAYNGSIS
jgi:hypothetical protein